MQLLVQSVRERLFEDPTVRERMLRDYSVTTNPTTPADFAQAIVDQFDQAPHPQPLDQQRTDQDVFRAAVKALGSNSRPWATFLRFEPRLRAMLHDYDPVQTDAAIGGGDLSVDVIRPCLPGLSSTADATAIMSWAKLLVQNRSYFDRLRKLGTDLQAVALEKLGRPLSQSRLPLLLVGFLARSGTRGTPEDLRGHRQRLLLDGRPPGMRYILASEFIRNLRFSAFKPDRHVQRLFDRWFPHARDRVDTEVKELQSVLGSRAKDLGTYLGYSLIGIEATPPGVSVTYADNLVWLLGAYVEKKGRESNTVYARGS